ncbi:MAG: hypothetical protein ACI85U_003132, partial [Candidatus Promineifilaceae bacterium]
MFKVLRKIMPELIQIITSADPAVRNQSLDAFCRTADLDTLLTEATALDDFRRHSDNLYERVRALFFLYAIHRFHLPAKLKATPITLPLHLTKGEKGERQDRNGKIPFDGVTHLRKRRFEEAIDTFLHVQTANGPSDAISSALAESYHNLGFQTLADQVRRSVRSARGNQWMFRIG